jgi:hypothetical protein
MELWKFDATDIARLIGELVEAADGVALPRDPTW